MEEEIIRQVAPSVTMIVLISVMILPIAIWDSQTGRYRGYLNWRAAGVLLFTAAYFGNLSYTDGDNAWEIFSAICVNLGQAVIGSRIFIEFSNQSMHKIWLRRRYHKLTGHEDTPWGVAPSADGASQARIDERGDTSQ
ncbi:MAG: hypothetical protein F4X05_12685 [Rhodothermaceae bacterium]|nr:hypothetical protein [Gammaproteobacteria bacterium]MYD20487.1 hypothetical protein [Rhodothermaceae bacterium]MYD69097.1 hypothetical protein [Rhodothermaceae bacterium]